MLLSHDLYFHNYITVGIYYELLKDYKKSLEYYTESLSIINEDHKLDDLTREQALKQVMIHINRLENKLL